MHHAVPYLILSVVSAAWLIYVLLRARTYAAVVLFLTFVGLIYLFEFIVLVLLDGYVYSPQIINNPYLDSMLGAFVSNFLAVPVAGITIVAFRLRYRWSIMLSLFFYGIEWLFLRLDIYEHHWWRTPYTAVSLLFFFWLTRYWANQAARGTRSFTYITLLLFALSMIDTWLFFLMLLGFRHLHLGIYSNPTHDDVFLTFVIAAINALILATVIYRTSAIRPIIAALVVVFVFHAVLIGTGILQLYIPIWVYCLIYTPCCILITWLLVKAKHTLAAPKKTEEPRSLS